MIWANNRVDTYTGKARRFALCLTCAGHALGGAMYKEFPLRLIIILLVAISFHIAKGDNIPPQVTKCVAFVFVEDTTGVLQPQGTAFFVSVLSEVDTTRFHGYLVTAKHVLMNENKTAFLPRIFVRLNKRSGGSDTLLLDLFVNQKPVFFVHQDTTVDIAVIPALPDVNTFDYMFIPRDLIITRELFEKENIRAGDDVFFTGLFPRHFGQIRNLPIVRFGKVAMISDEKVKWDKTLCDLYLIETTSFGGNSGSPLFFNLDPSRQPRTIVLGGPKLYLAGILIGYFPVATHPDYIEVSRRILWAFENSGIAAVVPALYIIEILDQPDLKHLRSRAK